ncbi:MAG TPA: cytochrome P450 [Steroidobacteraceae bacterium]|nr:cytochrome P450 [Steroidobacteraceae bacterium]
MSAVTRPDARRLAESFDPARLDAAFYENPYPIYSALREHSPVHRCPDGTWFLTRYRDLDQIYRDRTHFSSDKQAAFAPKFGADSPLFEHHTTSLVFRDAPYHTRVRRQIVGALTPHVLMAMEPGVGALVDHLHDELEQRGQFDLIEHFAAAIPIEVIGNLLQVPRAERAPLRGWSLAILGALEPVVSVDQRIAGDRAVSDFCAYLRGLIEARRRHPLGDDDLLTRLAGDTQLTEVELLHNCIFLLNAGHETTTNLIGNALQLLLGAPEALERLRADPRCIDGTIEECLRLESPNQLGNRLVLEPVRLGATELVPGDYLTLCIGAANRDPQEFIDPDRFDALRKPNRHLAFAAGAHACAGMSVARLEARIAILKTVQRFPDLHLTGGAVRGGRARFRGFKSLPAACR